MNTFDYMTLFSVKDNSLVTTKKGVRVYIPERYEERGVMTVGETVKTYAIFELEYGGKKAGVILPSMIEMCPSHVERVVEDTRYLLLSFEPGSVFIKNINVVPSADCLYFMFVEFISLGRMPRFIAYSDAMTMFDKAAEFTGVDFEVPHSVMEMIPAELYRDPDNPFVKFRHTDGKKKPMFAGLRNVALGPESDTARIGGSYSTDGLQASVVVNQSDKHSVLEDLLRG